MTVVADLHIHTSVSDGLCTLEEVCDLARAEGLSAIAITDHDRIHPDLAHPIETRDGLTVIRGIEVKVEHATGDHVDLLAYGIQRTDALCSLTDRLQEDRIVRARRITNSIENHLGITLDLPIVQGIGRPHIARALADHPETDLTVQDVFDELIGDGRPCHVSREIPEAGTVIEILEASAAIVAVAHPLRYSSLENVLSIAVELGAVERWYPYDHAADQTPVVEVIEEHGLLATGGSDAHDGSVGAAGLDEEAFAPIQDALGIV